MLKENTPAPAFTLADKDGKKHSLQDYRGKWLLVYFYPKDDTPGCTKEACAFRDNLPHFDKLAVQIVGISADSAGSHIKFADKYGLNFTLLSDPGKDVIRAYEAGGLAVKRISYLIDPDGNIFKSYAKVNPVSHAEEVLRDLQLAQTK